MTTDDIIESLRVISYYNKNLTDLHERFIKQAPLMSEVAADVEAAEADGLSIYETLVRVQVDTANCIHAYTYYVTRPLESLTTRNEIREQTCRDLFGLPVQF